MTKVLKHVQQVRILYKTILRLHRSLPAQAKLLGDLYVKAEFKRHKVATPEEVEMFMREWSLYAATLARQLGPKASQKVLGADLAESQLNLLRDEQIVQLFELKQSTDIPSDKG